MVSKAKTPSLNPDRLIDEAWGLIAEAIHKGQMTLSEREVPMILMSEHVVRLCQWLAHQKQKKPKLVSDITDFNPTGSDDGSEEP